MPKYIRSYWFMLAFLSLLLSACQTTEEGPGATPTLQMPTQTSPPIVKPTEIIIPTSTSKPTPSETPIPSPTSPLPTLTSDWTTYDLDAWKSSSPDGMWITRIVVGYPPQGSGGEAYHTWVRIDSTESSIGWTVVDEWLPIGLGMTTPSVLRWGKDGNSLFIADSGVPDGCGPRFFVNPRRIDLQSGEVTPLLDEESFGKLSISPHGNTLVALSQNAGLVVYDLAGGETHEIIFARPEEAWWPGEIAWSPDGSEFLFDLSSNPCGDPDQVTSSIWLASLDDSEASPLIQGTPNRLSLQNWPETCLAQVTDREGGVWWLDPCMGEISQTPPAEVGLALDTLLHFFNALHQGNYAEAVEYYGASYETLQYLNPSIDPSDQAGLLNNACQSNGYKCLPVLSYELESQPGPDEFRFSVSFDQEGQAFVLGPCCGASAIDEPPVEQFTYTVKKDPDGTYRVQELPVYVP